MIWLLLIFLTPADGQISNTSLPICAGSRDIKASFELPLEPQNQYTLKVFREIHSFSRMILRFDSEVSLTLIEPSDAQISKFPGPSHHSYQYIVTFADKTSTLGIQVFGPASGHNTPHVLSVILNDVELCTRPKTGYFVDEIRTFEEISSEVKDISSKFAKIAAETSLIDESCGRRQLLHTALIAHEQLTQPGDWPWHAAILKLDGFSPKYRCGGTLLSKTLVLTAAHCATERSNPILPNLLTVFLGKYNLFREDIASQERGVSKVIVHSEFDGKILNNDIALLILNSEAVFDDYVQPACLWHPALPTHDEVDGKVVGWGLNQQGMLSPTLQLTTVPIVSELKCLKSNPIFFANKLNLNKFCGGFANGTSVCNGESGGGLMIFVPDGAGVTGKATGAWYVRGIFSLAPSRTDLSICDPYQYTIFTDVEKYRNWVMAYLE